MKFCPSKELIAHMTYDNDMETVLPDRIAPSAIIPSMSLTAEFFVHQFNTILCLREKG